MFLWDTKENKESEIGDRTIILCTYKIDIIDFLSQNKDKTIVIYMGGCDLANNIVRGYAF